jgi:steroid delta-isomerase-like uncharacterized protein
MVARDMNRHIERAIEAFNDHDPDRLMDEMAEGSTFTDPLEEDLTGEELHEYTGAIFEAFPDLRLEVKRVITSNGGVTTIECNYVGTHEGPLEGIPPTGNSVVVPSMTVIDVSDDGITSWRDYWDRQMFTEQLGLEFPAIVPLLPKIVLRKVKTGL